VKGPGAFHTARLALGLVWLYQGIVPKLLFPLAFELSIVERSHLYLHTPRAMLFGVGLFEAGIGLWILSGYRPRLAAWSATAFMLLLQSLVLLIEPSLLLGPFGGIIKNIGLVALAWIMQITDAEASFPKSRAS
jgi:uncharacterized membrane protein YphA (DoxX/SURF4 family)